MGLSGGAGRPLLIRECCHFGIWLLTKLAASLNWSKFEANSIGPQLVISEETPYDNTIKLKRANIFLPFTRCLLWFRRGSGSVSELGSFSRSCACSKPGNGRVVDGGHDSRDHYHWMLGYLVTSILGLCTVDSSATRVERAFDLRSSSSASFLFKSTWKQATRIKAGILMEM